jgi:1-piperideine-2-carboxylate/1-pyrroline-2-carboxylate reductase [NAD(P)H]
MIFNALQTAQALPYAALAAEVATLLQDPSVQVPARLVQTLPSGGSLFVMPAHDARIAITKLITLTPANALPANAALGLPTIMGDVVVFSNATGQRLGLLDGPTVTARRTAAVSLLAAQKLATVPTGPVLIIGAGVQGCAHLEAFVQGLGVRQVMVCSRSARSAQQLVQHAQALYVQLGVAGQASVVTDLASALPHCPLVLTCTPAQGAVLHDSALLHPKAFVCAVGAFTPKMTELSPSLVQHFAPHGRIVVDTADAAHEAGDLMQAGIDISACATLQQIVKRAVKELGQSATAQRASTMSQQTLFKSCGWAGWDLAAARLALPAP